MTQMERRRGNLSEKNPARRNERAGKEGGAMKLWTKQERNRCE